MRRIDENISVEIKHFPENIEKIIAEAALGTFGKKMSDEELENALPHIFNESVARGHSSLTTMPKMMVKISGSRVWDYFFTAVPFTRALMMSTRRVGYKEEDILIPEGIKDERSIQIYKSTAKSQFKVYEEMKGSGVPLDVARRVLGLEFPSYGTYELSLDTAVELAHLPESKYLPREINTIAKKIAEVVAEKAPNMYAAKVNCIERFSSNLYPFPNIFSNPDLSKIEPSEIKIDIDDNFWKIKEALEKNYPGDRKYYETLPQETNELINIREPLELSLAAYNELKRHSTLRIQPESIYNSIDRINRRNIDTCIYKPHELNSYAEIYKKLIEDSLESYHRLLDQGVEPRDAVYIVPQAIKTRAIIKLDAYNLFHPFGFFGNRLCSKADRELQQFSLNLLKGIEKEEPRLRDTIGPKCKIGACSEETSCGWVKQFQLWL